MSFVLQRSPGGTQVRNAGGTKNRPPLGPCTYAGLLGFWPICGMGPWNGNASPTNYEPGSDGGNPNSMIDVWPNVYRTLTVVWQHDTGPKQTTVYQYQDYCDVPVTVTTTTDPGWYPPYGYTGAISFTNPDENGDPLAFSQAYTSAAGVPGTFTATLSNQWIAYDPATATDHWADKVALALNLIMSGPTTPRYAIGTPSGSMDTIAYFPVVDNSSYYLAPTANVAGSDLDAGYVCAAALGVPVRDFNWPPEYGFLSVVPAFATIMDFDEPGGGIYPNQGGVICVASTWVLTGIAPSVIYPTPTNHKTLYAQEFVLPKFNMGPIIQPYPTFFTSASGLNHPNPLTLLPITITFVPGDVPKNFDENPGPAYGLLGFHNNWTAGTDGDGNGYPGAGQTYIGAAPATGGAGGSGPQPGAGGGAPPV